jgi:antimicrobial peptide system SdpA family protein
MKVAVGEKHAPHHRTIGVFVVGLTVVWGVVVLYVAQGNLPYNALSLPLQNRLDIRAILPEGWAFFTKSPRSERATTFRRIGDQWVSASRGPQSHWSNLWGLNRSTRAQGVETGLLLQRIPAAYWRKCSRVPVTCLAADTLQVHLKVNRSPRPTLCGEIAIVLQNPTPWAWSRSGRIIEMPSRYVRMRVKC